MLHRNENIRLQKEAKRQARQSSWFEEMFLVGSERCGELKEEEIVDEVFLHFVTMNIDAPGESSAIIAKN